MSTDKLSLIVPIDKERKTIFSELKKMRKTLRRMDYQLEIILVVIGKQTKTVHSIKNSNLSNVKILKLPHDRGQGYVLKHAIRFVHGEYVGFVDKHLAIDAHDISLLIKHMMLYRADVIVGSKKHPVAATSDSQEIHIFSSMYQFLVWILFHVKMNDIQIGVKMYRRNCLVQFLPYIDMSRNTFDLEMLVAAHHLGFKRIYEAPISQQQQIAVTSPSQPLKNTAVLLMDTANIFYRLHVQHHYDSTKYVTVS